MNKNIIAALLLGVVGAAGLFAQKAPPKPKSQKEVDALMAIQNATTPDARIAAVDALLTNFADTDFKVMALQTAAMSAQQKGDFEKMVVYAERTLEADPNSYGAMLMLATGFSAKTREFDLDKEEKRQGGNAGQEGAGAAQDRREAESPDPGRAVGRRQEGHGIARA